MVLCVGRNGVSGFEGSRKLTVCVPGRLHVKLGDVCMKSVENVVTHLNWSEIYSRNNSEIMKTVQLIITVEFSIWDAVF